MNEHFKVLGFTQLESDIYRFLLRSGTSTGYSIAKGINKPAANVYKSLETLRIKGGVVSSMNASKSFAAVGWQELLDRQKRDFDQQLTALSEHLKSIDKPDTDEQVYQIGNGQQLLQSTRRLIDNAQQILLGDLEPEAVNLFAQELKSAADRGVEVRIKAYEAVEIKDVHITLRGHGPDIHNKSHDVSFSLCADGIEFITAMITAEDHSVIQAFRSHSALMTMTVHNNILYGQVLTDIKKALKDNNLKHVKTILESTEHLHPFSAENIVFKRIKNRYRI